MKASRRERIRGNIASLNIKKISKLMGCSYSQARRYIKKLEIINDETIGNLIYEYRQRKALKDMSNFFNKYSNLI